MMFKAFVKDKETGERRFIEGDYPSKSDFITDLQHNGYSVSRTEPKDLYDFVMDNFNGEKHEWEIAKKLYKEGKPLTKEEYEKMKEENVPGENYKRYPAFMKKKTDDKLDHEIVNDFAIDAIKDNFTPPGAEDEEEYYEDDGGRVYTWGELKKDIDDWVKKPDFGEQFANEDERKGYFNSDSTPNYRKIYKDFWDIGSNGAMSQISKDRAKELRDDIDTNDNGEIEVDEMADFQKSLDDYASKNKKGREDIPATYKR